MPKSESLISRLANAKPTPASVAAVPIRENSENSTPSRGATGSANSKPDTANSAPPPIPTPETTNQPAAQDSAEPLTSKQEAKTTIPPKLQTSSSPLPPLTLGHGSASSTSAPAEPDNVDPIHTPEAPTNQTNPLNTAADAGIPPPAPQMDLEDPPKQPPRRTARRRPAGPSRAQTAANDDVPSIGGLIYALNQRPSNRPFVYASAASGLWAAIVLSFALTFFGHEIARIGTMAGIIQRPELLTVTATLVGPILLIWFLAFLIWRTEELRLRSTAMTEVAIRLAEPDRMAEQSVASLGQAVRRQVSFMNDAVERALGRAGELEAIVHKEVAELERSYEENETRIQGLIRELATERNALLTTSGSVTETLKDLGGTVPNLIDRLAQQQIVLTEIIDGASTNLTALETAIASQTGNLEQAVGSRTEHLQIVLEEYTSALGTALDTRTEKIQGVIADQRAEMDHSLTERTEEIQSVFEEYTRALDASLSHRAEALDVQLIERTRELDNAFNERLRLFDESIQRSTEAIDGAVTEKALALNSAMETHAKSLGDMLGNQATHLDESLMQGIQAVRRTSENITRQSIQAIEGLSKQSEMLQNISENLLSEIHGVTNRFENQGQNIMRAANALESANVKIDGTLQTRQAELQNTLDQLSDRANLLGTEFQGYSTKLEGTMSEAERRARMLTSELNTTAQEQSRFVLSEIERLKQSATQDTTQALEDLRNKFSSVSDEVSSNLDTLTNRVTEASTAATRTTAEAAKALEAEQQRLRAQISQLPAAARDGSNAMRQALQDQLRALEQLSHLQNEQARQRDITRPSPTAQPARTQAPPRGQLPPPGLTTHTPTNQSNTAASKELATLSSSFDRELRNRPAAPHSAPAPYVTRQQPPQQQPQQSTDNWSLAELLQNASSDDDAPPMAGPIDIQRLASAIDPNTASAVWSRLGAGQQGIMVRSIYSPEGRITFDDAYNRYRSDPAYQSSVNTYITDFENLLEQAEAKDPSGRTGQDYLLSDVGRAYLVLAHATGRIT